MKSSELFINGIQNLLSSNFLTAGKDVTEFLMMLSSDEELKSVLRSANENSRFETEFERVFVRRNPLPKQNGKVVSLITNLLYRIDTGSIPLAELLNYIYPSSDKGEAYKLFLSDYVMPYAECFVNLLIGEPEEEVKEPNNTFFDKMNEDVTALCDRFLFDLKSLSVPVDKIVELTERTNGLVYSLSFKDSLLAKNAFCGLSNTLRLFGIKSEFEKELRRILTLYGVL